MVEQIFLIPQVKPTVIISTDLVYSYAATYDLRILGNIRKSQNFIESLPGAQSSCGNENFVSTSKNVLKNRN